MEKVAAFCIGEDLLRYYGYIGSKTENSEIEKIHYMNPNIHHSELKYIVDEENVTYSRIIEIE